MINVVLTKVVKAVIVLIKIAQRDNHKVKDQNVINLVQQAHHQRIALHLLQEKITAVIVIVKNLITTGITLKMVTVRVDHFASMIIVIKYVMHVIQTGTKKVDVVAIKTTSLHKFLQLNVNSMNYQKALSMK